VDNKTDGISCTAAALIAVIFGEMRVA